MYKVYHMKIIRSMYKLIQILPYLYKNIIWFQSTKKWNVKVPGISNFQVLWT